MEAVADVRPVRRFEMGNPRRTAAKAGVDSSSRYCLEHASEPLDVVGPGLRRLAARHPAVAMLSWIGMRYRCSSASTIGADAKLVQNTAIASGRAAATLPSIGASVGSATSLKLKLSRSQDAAPR
jgi:hypothetical protein